MCCLNLIVKTHSSECATRLVDLIQINSKIIRELKVFQTQKDPLEIRINSGATTQLKFINDHLNSHQLQIWQQLTRENRTEIAEEFCKFCNPQNLEIINQLQEKRITISLSNKNINFLESIFQFFNSCHADRFNQLSIIIKELACAHSLFDSVVWVANLQDKRIIPGDFTLIKVASISKSSISFPFFLDKIKSLIKNFTLSLNSASELKRAAIGKCIFELECLYLTKSESGCLQFSSSSDVDQSDSASTVSTSSDSSKAEEEYAKYKLIMFCWGIPEEIINQLVPSVVFDDLSLLTLTEKKIQPFANLHYRKHLFRKVDELQKSLASRTVPMPDVSAFDNKQLCFWFQALGYPFYVPSLRKQNVTGKQFVACTSDGLKDIGIDVIGHRKALLRAKSLPHPNNCKIYL